MLKVDGGKWRQLNQWEYSWVMSFDLTGMDGGVGKQNCFYMWRMSLVEGYKEGLTRDCGKSDLSWDLYYT